MSAVAKLVAEKVGAGTEFSNYRKRMTIRVDLNTLFRLELLSEQLRESKTRTAEMLVTEAVKDALAATHIEENHPDVREQFEQFIAEHAMEWDERRIMQDSLGIEVEEAEVR